MVRQCRDEKDVSEIIPNLWLGNYKSALSKNFISRHNIKYIINATKEYPNAFENDDIKYLKIPFNDSDSCYKDVNKMFDTCYIFILNALKEKSSILVHCKKGHHRSASIVASFLIRYLGLDYITIVLYINKLRKCALTRNACILRAVYEYYIKYSYLDK